jgi:hypothetical protein
MTSLRDRLEKLSDGGASFRQLLADLERDRHQVPPSEYDALWLFCWALARRRPGPHGSPVWNGETLDGLLSTAEG